MRVDRACQMNNFGGMLLAGLRCTPMAPQCCHTAGCGLPLSRWLVASARDPGTCHPTGPGQRRAWPMTWAAAIAFNNSPCAPSNGLVAASVSELLMAAAFSAGPVSLASALLHFCTGVPSWLPDRADCSCPLPRDCTVKGFSNPLTNRVDYGTLHRNHGTTDDGRPLDGLSAQRYRFLALANEPTSQPLSVH